MTKNLAMTADVASRPARRRSVVRIIGVTAFSVVAGVIVVALIAAGFVAWTVQRSFPQLEGQVTAAGLNAEVSVLRDTKGVPTIEAGDTHDLFFAQGYVHAQDRFWEMDFRRHVTSGRVAELFGESQLGTDKFIRTLGWRRVAEQEVAQLDPAVLAHFQAYADGVNAYLADHGGADVSLEYAILGVQNSDYEIEPWTPADSVAWLKAMAWDLRDNIESEVDRALLAANGYTAEQIGDLYPGYPFDEHPVIVPTITTDAPAASAVPAGTDASAAAEPATRAAIQWSEVGGVVEAVDALVGGAGEGIGSNSWVVAGDLTESGFPILANDPHLSANLPNVWHQVALRCTTVSPDCAFDVAGFGFSGVPGVIIGHNAQVAWGFTNLTIDVTDLYVEKVEGDSYWRDGQLVPLDIITETIEVAGGDDVELEIRSTVHGPIISGLSEDFTEIARDPYTGTSDTLAAPSVVPAGEDAVSLRWTALEPGTTAASIFALNLAQDFAEFRAAAALFAVPGQNLVYADVEGNIGYQTPSLLPIRGAGDGWLPQPGWDSAYDWRGYIPFDQLPVAYNPDSGYIVTANNAVVGADYTYALTRDWDRGYRAARIADLLQRKIANGKLTVDDMRDIQADTELWMGARLAVVYADVQVADGGAQAGLALLNTWDAQNVPDSAAAAYVNVLWDEITQDLFGRRDEPVPMSSQSRLFQVVDGLLDQPDSAWWTNEQIGVDGRDELLAKAAVDAFARLSKLQGEDPSRWNWGQLHALTLTSSTFGSSGIAPLEALFNRGPYPVGGGSAVVDATGWTLGDGFATVTVPSMRMIIDLSDFDASRWNHLTGASGHAFHPNYTDQTDDWQHVRVTPWPFSAEAVRAAATHTLVLRSAP